MYNDLHLHYVRTKVVNRALMEVADPAIYEQIRSDIESKYGGFKSLEDLKRWIHDLPEYYKKFGNALESFIINVLNPELESRSIAHHLKVIVKKSWKNSA